MEPSRKTSGGFLFVQKMKNIRKLVIIIIAISAIAGIFVSLNHYSGSRIPAGYYIGKAYVGGLTAQEAAGAIGTFEADEIYSKPLSFYYQEDKKVTRFEFWPSQIGARVRVSDSVNALFFGFEDKNIFSRIWNLQTSRKTFTPLLRIDSPQDAVLLLEQVKEYIDRPSADAKFTVVTFKESGIKKETVLVEKDIRGKKMLVEDSYYILQKGLAEGRTTFPLSIESFSPAVTRQMLEAIPSPEVIGSYSTYFGKYDSPGRVHNIRLSASFINNCYIGTGETFSLIKEIGEFSEERGFQDAYVIFGDELVPELGGGACQVATTLYNAVMLADLDVISRSNHGIYFSIYPLGRDAVIYPPYADFKFKNDTGTPIVVQSVPLKKGINIRIIGKGPKKTVKFSSPKIQYKHTTITTRDSETGEVSRKEIKTDAFRTEVVKTVVSNGKASKKETIKSFYKMHGDRVEVKKRDKPAR